jgi:hypothetical protein
MILGYLLRNGHIILSLHIDLFIFIRMNLSSRGHIEAKFGPKNKDKTGNPLPKKTAHLEPLASAEDSD